MKGGGAGTGGGGRWSVRGRRGGTGAVRVCGLDFNTYDRSVNDTLFDFPTIDGGFTTITENGKVLEDFIVKHRMYNLKKEKDYDGAF